MTGIMKKGKANRTSVSFYTQNRPSTTVYNQRSLNRQKRKKELLQITLEN
jgi:hypothetical protein